MQELTEKKFIVTNSEVISIKPQITNCDLFVMKDGVNYIFSPKDDITPLESVRLVQWIVSHHNSFYSLNFDFLDKYNLWRHFDTK